MKVIFSPRARDELREIQICIAFDNVAAAARVARVTAWTASRNQAGNTVDWRFTTEDARIKLKTLYPCTDKDQAMVDIAC